MWSPLHRLGSLVYRLGSHACVLRLFGVIHSGIAARKQADVIAGNDLFKTGYKNYSQLKNKDGLWAVSLG